MSRRDMIGLGVLVLIMISLVLLLVWTGRRPSGKIHAPKDSVFVEQRMNNLQKSK